MQIFLPWWKIRCKSQENIQKQTKKFFFNTFKLYKIHLFDFPDHSKNSTVKKNMDPLRSAGKIINKPPNNFNFDSQVSGLILGNILILFSPIYFLITNILVSPFLTRYIVLLFCTVSLVCLTGRLRGIYRSRQF